MILWNDLELYAAPCRGPGRKGECIMKSRKQLSAILAVTACTMSLCRPAAFAADTSMELGPNAIAKGNGAIATGSNTAAIGKGAVATGNNLTAEQLQELLNKKKAYEDNLKTAQANADASQQAYNKARSEYETADVNNGIVDRANEAIKGYQDQINSTLKPNADTADAAYTKAKNDYDTLYNDFQNRIATIKTLDFTLYQDGSAAGYDLDKMASDLKTKTEEGTSFNEPVDFYKSYIQNYIKAEGDLRLNKITANNLNSSINNGSIINLSQANYQLLGLESNSSYSKLYTNKNGYSSYDTSDYTVYLNDSDTTNKNYYSDNWPNSYRITLNEFASKAYDDTLAINDDYYTSQIKSLKTNIESKEDEFKSSLNKSLDYYASFGDKYTISTDTKNAIIDSYKKASNNYLSREIARLDAEHYQYLYEHETDNTKKLEYLSKKELALKAFNSIASTSSDSNYEWNTGFYKLQSYYNGIYYETNNLISNWIKTNVTDIEDATKVSLKSMQDGLDAEIQAKKKAMDDALTAKNTADQALSDMQQKIKDTEPTAEQLAEAAKYADKKKAMEDAAAKLAADKAALEKAQQDIGSLTDLSHIGENAIAYGTDALVSGSDAVGIGTDVIVTGTNAIGMGKGTVVSGNYATAIGQDSKVSGISATSLGSQNTVTGDSSTAVGNGHTVLGTKSGAFGAPSHVYGDGSYAIGNDNTIGAVDDTTHAAVTGKGLNTFVLGSGITTTANNAVILGYGSTDGGDNTVSVGSSTQTRRLVNVGDGVLSATSTDAVTGRQLYTTNQNMAGFADQITKNASKLEALSTSVTNSLDSVSAMSESVSTIDNTKSDASLNNLSDAGKEVIHAAATEAVQAYMKNLNNTGTAKSAMKVASAKMYTVPSSSLLTTSLIAVPTAGTLDTIDSAADLSGKADVSYVDEGLATKADKGTVYTKEETDQKLTGKADTDLKNLSDVGKGVIKDVMKDDMAKKADKSAVDEALTKKADADASNIDAAAYAKKLGTGTVTSGDTNLVTGNAVYTALTKSGIGLVQSDGQVMTVGAKDRAAVVDFHNAAGSGRVLTGVTTNASDLTSAANVGYVNSVASGLSQDFSSQIQQTSSMLTRDINKVGAGAAALAGLHPGEYDPADKWDFAAGYGHYKGANASAFGAYYHPNEDTLISLSGTIGNGDPMLSAGVTFKLGSGVSPHTMSRTALTKELNAVQQQNQVLAAKNEQLESDVETLKAQVRQLLTAQHTPSK